MEFGYFGDAFGRPGPGLPWMTEAAEDNADMYATVDESTKWVVDLYRRGWAHADTTIDELPLDAVGMVGQLPRHPAPDCRGVHRRTLNGVAHPAASRPRT